MGGIDTAHALPARAGVRSTRHRPAFVALVLVLAVAVLVAGAFVHPAPAVAGIGDTIAGKLQAGGFAGSGTGVYVWDIDAARLVYASNASTELAPASNMKLVTSAAAMMDWGAEHRFTTELYGPDVPVAGGGVVYGDLYLRGLGDPSLSTRSFQRTELDLTTASFEAFARDLKRDGVKKVQGRVFGDSSWFDKLATVPTWKPGLQLECGPLSALSGNQGLDDGNRVRAPAVWAARLMTEALRNAGVKVTGRPGSGHVPEYHPAREAPVLGGAPRHHEAHEQGERQLLRRGPAQGAGQGLLRRGQHGGGHAGERCRAARLRTRGRHLRHPGRLRAELRRPAHGQRAS